MIWKCMGWNGVVILAKVEERVNTEQYGSIFKDNLLPTMENSEIPKESIIFQQDNNPNLKYTSKRAKKWLDSQEIKVLD